MLAPEDHDHNRPNPMLREEAEQLMIESIENSNIDNVLALFVLHYKDPRPELDEAGRPRLRRNTPLHLAARLEMSPRAIDLLFKMYSANYVHESGLTHFHVACQYGFEQQVEAFLDDRQDPNSPGPGGNSALHLAVAHFPVIELLLKRGARPNVVNEAGLMPLQLAADQLHSLTVEALLKKHVDHPPGFVFPIEAYLRHVERFEQAEFLTTFRALKLIEVVETGEYYLNLEDAGRIVRAFVDTRVLEITAQREEQLEVQTEQGQILSSNLTLQNVLNMPNYESKLTAVEECFPKLELGNWRRDELVPAYERSPITRVCYAAARILFRRWTARVLFWFVHARLPVEVCYLIGRYLSNQDMLNLFTASGL